MLGSFAGVANYGTFVVAVIVFLLIYLRSFLSNGYFLSS